MVGGLAIALPIILAVMGVVVALNPPAAIGRVHWIWVGAFVLVGLAAIGVGIKDPLNADAAQEELKSTIGGLKDSIDKMTKPINAPSVKPARYPDALYQNENVVGKVIGARITLNESKIYFEQIESAGNLETNRNFEYREYILHFIRAESYVGMLIRAPGGAATSVYQHVVCEIVGRVH
jgi:hypothetical protein